MTVAPRGITHSGQEIEDPEEGLIRSARRAGRQRYFRDQVTGKWRPPAAAFEPRLPSNRPNAARFDKYLSVNVTSSLDAAGVQRDWRANSADFYCAHLQVAACRGLSLQVLWLPVSGDSDNPANPHHGGIQGVVELFYADEEAYEATITALAKASEVLPECIR